MSVRYLQLKAKGQPILSASGAGVLRLKAEFLVLVGYAAGWSPIPGMETSPRLVLLSILDIEKMRCSAIPFNPLAEFLDPHFSGQGDLRSLFARRFQEILEVPGFAQVWNSIREDLPVVNVEMAKDIFLRTVAMGMGIRGVLSPIGESQFQFITSEELEKLLASESPINLLERFVKARPEHSGDLRPQLGRLLQKSIATPKFAEQWKEIKSIVLSLKTYCPV